MTRSAASLLRMALEEFLAGEQRARLLRLRDPADDAVPPSRDRGRWLASAAGSDVLAEARERGELNGAHLLWLERHLQHVPRGLAVLGAGAELRTALAAARLPSGEALDLPAQLARLARADDDHARAVAARELEHALRPIALRCIDAHARAEQSLLVPRELPAPDGTPGAPRKSSGGLLIASAFSAEGMAAQAPPELPQEAWLADAAIFLARTQAAAEEAVARCTDKLGAQRPLPWHVLLRGLRAPELDSDSGAKLRWRRAAAWLRGLGFERELSSHMRAQSDRGGALPFASVVPLAIPGDVRTAQITADFGVAADVLAAGAVGHALGLTLVHAALPAELRWPLGASTAGALGALALQLWGERQHLLRVQHMPEAAAARVGRLAGALALLHARAQVAIATAPLADAGKPEARQQALADGLGRALCCDVPESIAGLLGADRVQARARAREALAGLSLHVALRERFDVDWFRNPHSEELLRATCASGNERSVEEVCVELGASADAACERALELVM